MYKTTYDYDPIEKTMLVKFPPVTDDGTGRGTIFIAYDRMQDSDTYGERVIFNATVAVDEKEVFYGAVASDFGKPTGSDYDSIDACKVALRPAIANALAFDGSGSEFVLNDNPKAVAFQEVLAVMQGEIWNPRGVRMPFGTPDSIWRVVPLDTAYAEVKDHIRLPIDFPNIDPNEMLEKITSLKTLGLSTLKVGRYVHAGMNYKVAIDRTTKSLSQDLAGDTSLERGLNGNLKTIEFEGDGTAITVDEPVDGAYFLRTHAAISNLAHGIVAAESFNSGSMHTESHDYVKAITRLAAAQKLGINSVQIDVAKGEDPAAIRVAYAITKRLNESVLELKIQETRIENYREDFRPAALIAPRMKSALGSL